MKRKKLKIRIKNTEYIWEPTQSQKYIICVDRKGSPFINTQVCSLHVFQSAGKKCPDKCPYKIPTMIDLGFPIKKKRVKKNAC